MANLTEKLMRELEHAHPGLEVLETTDHPFVWLEIWNNQLCDGSLRETLEESFPAFKN